MYTILLYTTITDRLWDRSSGCRCTVCTQITVYVRNSTSQPWVTRDNRGSLTLGILLRVRLMSVRVVQIKGQCIDKIDQLRTLARHRSRPIFGNNSLTPPQSKLSTALKRCFKLEFCETSLESSQKGSTIVLTSSAGLHASRHVHRIAEETVAWHGVTDDARHHWSRVQPCPCQHTVTRLRTDGHITTIV